MLSEYFKLKENLIEFKFNFVVQCNGQYTVQDSLWAGNRFVI